MSISLVNKSSGDLIPAAGNLDSAKIGSLSSLTTQNKTSLVSAINEVNAKEGNESMFEGTTQEWNALTTEQKKTYDYVFITDDYDPAAVGNLDALTTTTKTSLVAAVNEVNDKVSSYHFSVVDGKLCVTYTQTT